MGNRKTEYRGKKRAFHGNRFTKPSQVVSEGNGYEDRSRSSPQPSQKVESASSAKLAKFQPSRSVTSPDSNLKGFRLMDISLLEKFIRSSVECPSCKTKNMRFIEKRWGLASELCLLCSNPACKDMKTYFRTSEMSRGCFDINRMLVMSLMSIGKNFEDGEKVCAGLNLPPPQSRKSWSSHMSKIHAATRSVSVKSMVQSAEEVKLDENTDEVCDTTVSCDGTWQGRGFASKNGVATVLTVRGPRKASKVVDTHVLSNFCYSCSLMRKVKTDLEFEEWHNGHKDCQRNYEGSACGMEATGVERIFRRSMEDRGLRYTGYLGDGDSKSYSTVVKANIYPDKDIIKLECCGHVQKRMGRRLMEKVSSEKNTFFTENGKRYKGIGGIGKLMKKAILRIQGHYGAAIRNNPHKILQMKKDVWAIFKHKSKDHSDCGSWCPSQTGKGDPNKNSLPDFVLTTIKPVFDALASDILLEKCVHGGTQNTNDSFHNLIWTRCPKTVFVSRQRLEIAVDDAAIVFNYGERGRLPIYEQLGLSPMPFMSAWMQTKDARRVKRAYVGTADIIAKRRKVAQETSDQWDSSSYDPGNF